METGSELLIPVIIGRIHKNFFFTNDGWVLALDSG